MSALFGALLTFALHQQTAEAQAANERVGGMAMGGSWGGESFEQQLKDLDGVAEAGASYIRMTFNWSTMERIEG